MELKAFQGYLNSQGLKFTRPRRLIFKEIFSSKKVHPNAYEIHRKLKRKGQKVSLATIYRTLKAAHGHLVCLTCGEVKEFSHEKIQTILNKIGKGSQFKTDKFSIQIFGYCTNCQKR
jgi:Fur family ferric uptake transcriptional regulator